jgi:hypothetical protein
MRLLSGARPISLDPDLDPAERARILEAAMAERASLGPPRRGTWWGSPRPRPALGLGAIAVALAIVLLAVHLAPAAPKVAPRTPAPPGSIRWTENTQPAQDVLLAAARQVEATPTRTSGRYWHTTVRIGGFVSPGLPPSTGGVSAHPPPGAFQTDRWVAASVSDTTWFSGGYASTAKPSPRPADPYDWGARRFEVEGRALTISDLQQLPTDPAGLRAFLLQPYANVTWNTPADLTYRLFSQLFELSLAPVTPAVRAAAFRVLAGMPGAHALGHVADALGRIGVGVGVTQGSEEHQLVIAPSTGSVLGTQDVAVKSAAGGAPTMSGTIGLYQVIVESGWTDAVSP